MTSYLENIDLRIIFCIFAILFWWIYKSYINLRQLNTPDVKDFEKIKNKKRNLIVVLTVVVVLVNVLLKLQFNSVDGFSGLYLALYTIIWMLASTVVEAVYVYKLKPFRSPLLTFLGVVVISFSVYFF